MHCRAVEADAALERLLDCIRAIDAWMGSNRLKMKSDKKQIIWQGTRQQLVALLVTPIRLHDGTTVVPSTSVCNLGVLFDNEMTAGRTSTASPAAVSFTCGSYVSFGDHSYPM